MTDHIARAGGVEHLEARLIWNLLRALGSPALEVELSNGQRVCASARVPVGRVRVRDRGTLWRIVALGERAIGDAYCDGRLDVEGDLAALLTELFDAWPSASARSTLGRIRTASRALRRTDVAHARDNVEGHYDLGNAFYGLWLDRDLSYTCAYYATPELSLEAAQRAKLDHVARKLRLRPGERVVEAGGGWGALGLHLAREYGVQVRVYNVSREQVSFARARARRDGLADRVEFVEDDYRNIEGTYDAFVSVGMLEHVGYRSFPELAAVLDRSLGPRGRGLIHSIGRMRPAAMDPWLLRRIFPGAYIPAMGEMLEVLEPTDLEVLDVENLRLHYARTLEEWLERFEKHAAEVRACFDERFVRTWRLYLASSIASFRTSGCQLFQVLFARPGYSTRATTRADLYRPQTSRADSGDTRAVL